jgi:heat shock protein HslJ
MKIKRIFIFLAPLLFAAANMAAQNNVDLSKLSPDQVEAYKQYMATGKATAADTVAVRSAVKERTVAQTAASPASQVAGGASSVNGVFGSYLFGKQNLTFEPNINIPTPPYYVLGTYDEIIVDISGLYEANYRLKVNTEGFIRIPNIGPIKVGGITISEASKIIRNRLSAVYTGM